MPQFTRSLVRRAGEIPESTSGRLFRSTLLLEIGRTSRDFGGKNDPKRPTGFWAK